MVNEATLLQIFQDTVSIIPDGENSVFLGTVKIIDAPEGVNGIMEYWTKSIDKALLQSDINNIQKLELLTIRGFTFEEYTTLFDIAIKQANYPRYPIYQALFITTQQERTGFIYQLNKDSYEDYLTLLARSLRLFNPFLYSFLYETYA